MKIYKRGSRRLAIRYLRNLHWNYLLASSLLLVFRLKVIRPLAKKGIILGLLNSLEAFLWLFIGKKYFSIAGINEIHSFGFAILFFNGIFNILVIRAKTRFYKQPIGKTLLFAIIADVILSVFILTIGVPGFTALPIVITGTTLIYFLFCGFIINDWIKVKTN